MARVTHAQKDAHIASLESALEFAQSEVARLKAAAAADDSVPRAEYNRVQALLRTTQQFLAKYKRRAEPAEATPRIDWAGAAKAYCSAHGVASVSRADLIAYAKEQAHAE